MPDSLQNITFDPALRQVEEQLKADILEHEENALELRSRSSEGLPSTYGQKVVVDTLKSVSPPRKAIIMTAHKEPQMPVSPRSVGSTTTSWVILGLIAVFLLVSMRYARNFKFLSGIGRDLISKKPRNRMFDDTVREKSFLIFLNLLCIVSVGVLLFGGIEIAHPVLRNSAKWYTALGLVTGVVGIYYLWQWIMYFVLGRTFGTRSQASFWLRGFSSGQGFLGLALFPLALISIFYAGNLTVLIIIAASIYVIARILFVIKGIRIFMPGSTTWLPFFYYLCAVEIAPVVLIIHISTQLCVNVTAI